MSLPGPYFIVFELLMYALLGLCFSHAIQRGLLPAAQLLAGVLFGVLLEWATIQQMQAYHYGQFLLMLGEVPLAIGTGWGVIIYAARLYSDATSLPSWARPVLDGLLALNVDLAMDAVAIRLGFWNWAIDINEQWFGVPFANFWAWFWVVFFFSAGLRLFSQPRLGPARWLSPVGAILIGVAGVLATNRLIGLSPSYTIYVMAVVGVILGALLLVILLRPRLHDREKPALVALIPTGFHIYFLAAGVVSGAIFRPPVLLVVSLLMILVAALIHYQRPRTQRTQTAAGGYKAGQPGPPPG
jgi:hypothetical protein